jgi:hypothetical protein
MKQLEFSNYQWGVKTSNSLVGPGPNFFSEQCISLQEDGLRIELLEKDGLTQCGEVYLDGSLGYGRYIFQLASRIDLLPPNVVLGLFTWSNDAMPNNCEIDIEFSKWNHETITNSQFVVQPSLEGNYHRWNTQLNGEYSTHIFDWTPQRISFYSMHGHHKNINAQSMIQQWEYRGESIPEPSKERVHINLWCYKSTDLALLEGQIKYVVVKHFEYVPI